MIRVDRGFWERSDSASKLALMYHELGHCVCGYGHDKRLLDDGCPASVLSKELPDKTCIDKHRERYFSLKCGESDEK